MISNETVLYAIDVDSQDRMTFREVWKAKKGDPDGFCAGYTSLCTISVTAQTYLCGYNPQRSVVDFYMAKGGGGPVLTATAQLPTIRYTVIRPMYVGGVCHLICYEQTSGVLDFFRVSGKYTLESVYHYRQTYGIVSVGFTTLEPYYYRDAILLLGYNSENGTAVIYAITVPGKSPLTLSPVWTKGWSPGWCRFAFFQLGAENFFLKSNPVHHKVNIDHMVDDPDEGAHPVGTGLPLPLDLAAVAPLDIAHDPCFITYHATTGQTVCNRVWGDCRGWNKTASITTITGGEHLITFQIKETGAVMIY